MSTKNFLIFFSAISRPPGGSQNVQKLPKYGKNVKFQVFWPFWDPPGGGLIAEKKIQEFFCAHLGVF